MIEGRGRGEKRTPLLEGAGVSGGGRPPAGHSYMFLSIIIMIIIIIIILIIIIIIIIIATAVQM